MTNTRQSSAADTAGELDAVVVGAGFAGLYLLYRLRRAGYSVQAFEAGDSVGGTWYWNRYPGARCDAESLAYSFSFDPELEQEWEWSERYATQPEILDYAEHVADRYELRPLIAFQTRVTEAHYDAARGMWRVRTDRGHDVVARFCIMATGCLSVPYVPDIPGLDSFAGARYQASQWPHEPVDFTGQRVGVIGTGSSAIQAIPVIARQAAHLSVFQRTPNFSVPARNEELDPGFVAGFKERYREHRRLHKHGLASGFGDLEIEPRERTPDAESAVPLSDDEFRRICDQYWNSGGARFMGAFADSLVSPEANQRLAQYVHDRIRETVRDPETAEALCPTSHPIGTKRICVDIDYYETYNRSNVRLIDLNANPIERITERGIELAGEHVELDTLVLATGFDAMTGALARIDIRGAEASLKEIWSEGPKTYLGLMAAGFPNLFLITGPGSPSVLSNMLVSIEQHVDFVMGCLEHMKYNEFNRIEPNLESQNGWVAHVNEVADATLFPRGGSWYLGANVPGKPRVFMPYAAGVGAYRDVCDDVAANGYRGFEFR